ncbi:uracil-DNA glycosylase [Thermoflavimicrobium daqui]|uniref:Uracil-DNA glycosylase n=1 Tax=Thermoflavimicrobium daqui TaxID=2137476 RepID=A0A364K0L6_9BACL|nr:uracil-DNA glycosylase [Thermoflavimicrobium daqui]RAL21039.1 uracil-DNA glycosylase [Thermoflavimicrobium daqui]
MRDYLTNDWSSILKEEFTKPYFQELETFLEEEYKTQVIYPKREEIFSALQLTSYTNTKVVILGQDPYHGEGQAHGLSFSVKPGVKLPPSLRNIYKELQADLGCSIPNHGHLVKWAKQGVLMLNTVLTVRDGKPNSHKKKGWEIFTNQVITALNQREQPIVFILWGKPAQEKKALITNSHHFIIESAHPSPLAAKKGFFNSKPFSKTNEFLHNIGSETIDWQIPNIES